MLCIVSPDKRDLYEEELEDFFRLRKSVLIDQRGWDLKSKDGMEIDQYDHDQAHYLIYKDPESGDILGGVRLTPTLAPNLTLHTFSHMIDPKMGFIPSDLVWESSRFVTAYGQKTCQKGILREITLTLFIGMIEYGLMQNIHSLLTMTEIRLERIGRMAQWHLQRLGNVEPVGNTFAVVGLIEISGAVRRRMRENCGIWRPVFWGEGHDERGEGASFGFQKVCPTN
jgi:N-acyl-L-homoserine lactone synthetase